MLLESKYEDNVVLQKNTLQELLTNIKNYPIIDIDYVAEDEIDEQHDNTDNNNNPEDWKVWENYTNGTPCIKITYGDNTTTKGNVIFAEQLNQLIRKAKRELNDLNILYKEQDDIYTFLKEVYDVNNEIYLNRVETLNNWEAQQENQSENEINAIRQPEDLFVGLLTDEQSVDALQSIFNDIYISLNSTINNSNRNLVHRESKLIGETNHQIYVYIFTNRQDAESALQTVILNEDSAANVKTAASTLITMMEEYPRYEELPTVTTNDPRIQSIQQYVYFYIHKIIDIAQRKKEAAELGKNAAWDRLNEIDANRLIKQQNIETWQSWIPKIASGEYELVEDNSANGVGGYNIALNSGEVVDKTMYGYKYVKVGSNISFPSNATHIIGPGENNIDPIQKLGTFRMTINGHTYEIRIKGFDQAENDITTIIPADGAVNFGSATHPWNTIYGTSLGSLESPFTSGYFNSIRIGSVIIGNDSSQSQQGDSSKFLRGDGKWENRLEGNILITDETEAIRKSHKYKKANVNTMINNSILVLDETQEFISETKYKGLADNETGELYVVGDATGTLTIKDESSVTITTTAKEVQVNDILSDSYQYYDGVANTNFVLKSDGPYNTIDEIPEKFTRLVTHQYIFAENQAKNYYLLSNNIYTPCEQNVRYTNETVFYVLNNNTWYEDPATGQGQYNAEVTGSIATYGGISARKSIKGYKVYGAVFNDYAEYRTTLNAAEPGRCVVDLDDGSLQISTQRLIPGAQIISDTFGTCMGETEQHQTPLAVAGRVLAYPYRPRKEYHAGMAVCSAPNGTVDIMTREEIRNYPDAIIGIVSEIPQYDVWGSDNVQVNGRIWIKIK